MSLAKIREQWESGLNEILVIKDPNENVIVLLQDNDDPDEYYVHRYFQLGDDWQISIDWPNNIARDDNITNLQEALKFITDRFKEYIPV